MSFGKYNLLFHAEAQRSRRFGYERAVESSFQEDKCVGLFKFELAIIIQLKTPPP
jgi:hypothetical protein